MAALSQVRRQQLFLHREVYGQLHRILVDEVVQPFRFLDIACGDARATVETLRGMRVAHYYGIDLSQAALELASKALKLLGCPVTLDHRDFVCSGLSRKEWGTFRIKSSGWTLPGRSRM
jgi:hypothetical protein